MMQTAPPRGWRGSGPNLNELENKLSTLCQPQACNGEYASCAESIRRRERRRHRPTESAPLAGALSPTRRMRVTKVVVRPLFTIEFETAAQIIGHVRMGYFRRSAIITSCTFLGDRVNGKA